MTNYAAGPALRKDFPRVEKTVYVFSTDPVFFDRGEASSTKNFYYVDDNFLDVVRLPLLAGDAALLGQVGNAVIGRSEAIKRFGTDKVLGRTFTLISRGKKRDFKIVGILKDLPKSSHLRVSALMRIDAPRGTRFGAMGKYEILFPRGSAFELVGRDGDEFHFRVVRK
jgi:putative ABC transport system permease protein